MLILLVSLFNFISHSKNRYIQNEVFDGVSEYIIPKPALCGRLVSLYDHIIF